MSSREVVRAAGVLVHRGDRPDALAWLLLRNARLGHWGFAKGHLEPGEGELAGALREVREETGLVPRLDGAFREVIAYRVPATPRRPEHEKQVIYLLGHVPVDAAVVASPEHDRSEWLPLDEASRLLEHEQLRIVLARADRFVRRGR